MTGNRSIIVTGASSGIGAHCARRLKQEGWLVIATARNDADLAQLKSDGLHAVYLDYREPQSIAALVDTAMEITGGSLDALYNNGAYAQAGAVEDLSLEALREQFETNFFGWHDLTRRIVPEMRQQGHGRIVHCSSILGLLPVKYRGAYASSKYALEGLMLCLRAELAGSGIHVSLIEPGPIESKFISNSLAYFEKYIDIESSPYRDDYQLQIARLSGEKVSRFKLKPDAVYAVLRQALENNRPKPHYLVTTPAKLAMTMKRLLPSGMFYRLMQRGN